MCHPLRSNVDLRTDFVVPVAEHETESKLDLLIMLHELGISFAPTSWNVEVISFENDVARFPRGGVLFPELNIAGIASIASMQTPRNARNATSALLMRICRGLTIR